MYISTLTSKGQATIPSKIRQKLDLKPGEKVFFEDQGKDVVVKKIPDFLSLMGSLKTNKKYNKKAINKALGKMFAQKYQKINEQTSRR